MSPIAAPSMCIRGRGLALVAASPDTARLPAEPGPRGGAALRDASARPPRQSGSCRRRRKWPTGGSVPPAPSPPTSRWCSGPRSPGGSASCPWTSAAGVRRDQIDRAPRRHRRAAPRGPGGGGAAAGARPARALAGGHRRPRGRRADLPRAPGARRARRGAADARAHGAALEAGADRPGAARHRDRRRWPWRRPAIRTRSRRSGTARPCSCSGDPSSSWRASSSTDTVVTSPIEGAVSERRASVGEYLAAGRAGGHARQAPSAPAPARRARAGRDGRARGAVRRRHRRGRGGRAPRARRPRLPVHQRAEPHPAHGGRGAQRGRGAPARRLRQGRHRPGGRPPRGHRAGHRRRHLRGGGEGAHGGQGRAAGECA